MRYFLVPYDTPDPQMGFTPPYSVEIYEVGTWFEVDNRADLEETMWVASSYANQLGEKRVKVTDAKCREV